jgi:hypothetical protein
VAVSTAPGAAGPDPVSEDRSVRLALRVGAAQLIGEIMTLGGLVPVPVPDEEPGTARG